MLSLALAVLTLSASQAGAHGLPLGDGKLSESPRAGYLMPCRSRFRGGRVHGGPWIHGDTWDPDEKPVVQGRVEWPDHRIKIAVRGDERVISANNLPDHPTGRFPISRDDPAHRYDPNPNAIREQDILLRLPRDPKAAESPSCVPMGMVGFTTDGEAIYDAVDDSGDDAVAHEVQDLCNGHPQRVGQYHFHGPSPCMPNEKTSGLVGYALDGYGIYGLKDPKTGKTWTDADLDACHGVTGPVEWDGKTVTMYHYVLTAEYPYTLGCFHGTPVETGRHREAGSDRGDRERGRGRRGGRGRLERAARELGVSVDDLREAVGPPPPDIEGASRKLGIPADKLREALGVPSRR